ncbi:MAG: ComF family protein [Desulfobacterales bacterium]
MKPCRKNIWAEIRTAFVHAVFPPCCHSCRSFFHPPRSDAGQRELHRLSFEDIMEKWLCPECLAGFRQTEKTIQGKDFFPPRHFRIACSAGEYEAEKGFAASIRAYKYSGKRQLADPFGILLFSAWNRVWKTADSDLIIPVPLHNSRFRERGFNQAWLMIRNWPRLAEKYRTDFSQTDVRRNVLLRTRKTRPQAGLGKKEREENIRGAFCVAKRETVLGKRILLVDDVFTTGATVSECARVLLEKGAESVDVLTLARD